jgi:hypothetical protein
MVYKKTKIKYPELYTYDRYECWWEDASSGCQWEEIQEAVKSKQQICFTEGYLIQKSKHNHIFAMSFSNNDVGDKMIIPTKNIKSLKKTGTKIFYEKEFEYETYQN